MKSRFRLNAKKLSLTYSQTKLNKQELMEELKVKLNKNGNQILQYLVAEEEHKDGGKHLHAFIELEKRINVRDINYLDCKNEHGNYQSTRKKWNWLRYLTKEDPNPLTNFNMEELKEKMEKKGKSEEDRINNNLEFLEECKTLGPREMVTTGKVHLMKYQMLKRNYEEYMKDMFVDNREELGMELPNPWYDDFKVNIDIKQCHYWIYSRVPNLGKTTWAIELTEKYKAQIWNYLEIYQPHITPVTEVLILDEYRGQLRITQLNQICDGTWLFTAKGKDSWKLIQKPLVIVLSNKSIKDIYNKSMDYPLVEARFQEIEVQEFKRNDLIY